MPKTEFAAAERVSREQVEAQTRCLEQSGPLFSLLVGLPFPALVLNCCRQAISGNQLFLDLLGFADMKEIRGLRIGEIFNCACSLETLGGCGTSEKCRTCGVTLAVLSALENGKGEFRCEVDGSTAGKGAHFGFDQVAVRFECDEIPYVLVMLMKLRCGNGEVDD